MGCAQSAPPKKVDEAPKPVAVVKEEKVVPEVKEVEKCCGFCECECPTCACECDCSCIQCPTYECMCGCLPKCDNCCRCYVECCDNACFCCGDMVLTEKSAVVAAPTKAAPKKPPTTTASGKKPVTAANSAKKP